MIVDYAHLPAICVAIAALCTLSYLKGHTSGMKWATKLWAPKDSYDNIYGKKNS